MLNPLLKVAQHMYFKEKLGEYKSISYSSMLPHKNNHVFNGINLKYFHIGIIFYF